MVGKESEETGLDLSIESRCIHLENDHGENRFGAISFPIYQTATFSHPGLGQSTGYDYTRMQNPTREQLEKTVAALEKGCDCIVLAQITMACAAEGMKDLGVPVLTSPMEGVKAIVSLIEAGCNN